MKEFLESLYEIENFGIYLFVVIGVLVVLFLLILFFGKKSADERLEEFEEKENDNVNAFKTIENEVALDTPKVSKTENEEIKPSFNNEEDIVSENDTPINEEHEEHEETINNQVENKEFDFEALANEISKELESIDNDKKVVNEVKPVIEEHDELINVFKDSNQEPKKEESKSVPRPTVFSSVYVNRNNDNNISNNTTLKKEEDRVLPTGLDLPKRID